MELPEELLIEIMVQLPVKTLLRFKCVCKHWLSFGSDIRSVLSPTFCHSKPSVYPITKTHVVSVLDRHTLDKLEDLEWPPFLAEVDVDDAENSHRRINIIGPVNGIYCIHRSLVDKWVGTHVPWNPSTREYKHIHPQQEPSSLHIGFGFDHTTNDYKVVVICQWADEDMGVYPVWHLRIYNNATNSWRTVYYLHCDSPPYPLMKCDPHISQCLLNGVFHWACSVDYSDDDQHRVLTFDMTTNILQLMKAPPPLEIYYGMYWSMWVVKETIVDAVSYIEGEAVYDIYSRWNELQVWIMMEYGVEDSWAFLFKFHDDVIEWIPVGLPFEDRIFFDDENGQLISTDLDDDHHVEEHGVYGMRYSTHRHGDHGTLGILNYVETLTTLGPT
ncbi:hypothetical protein RND81_12G020500 [Saponaria officinalis]|uniref:F-box domain-containing protein n=1 Tax=Saponaria officinalis TaxID=3572 RepID=A0AAW1H283_SAPOF